MESAGIGSSPTAAAAHAGGSDLGAMAETIPWRQTLGLMLGPVLLVLTLLAPLPLDRHQQALAAVLVFTLTYWLSEALPLPVTSIVSLALCVVLDVPPASGDATRSAAEVIFADFSSPTLFLLIGGFILAQAMIKYELSRRMALAVLSLPGVARSTYLIVIAFGGLAVLLASVIDNGAVVAMLLPIAIGLSATLSRLINEQRPSLAGRGPLRFSTALLLITAYGATVGNLLTPVGSATNVIGRDFIDAEFGVRISFGEWVLMATPIVLVLFALLCCTILLTNKPEVRRIVGTRRLMRRERGDLGTVSRGEINTLIAFSVAIGLWLVPTIVGFIAGRGSTPHLLVIERLDPSVGAIVAAALLFVLPVDWRRRRFTMTWSDAAGIDWGTVLLVGTGLTLGKLMASTGLAELLGESIADQLGHSRLLVYLAAAGATILLSEITSNLATVGVILPIIPALALSGGGDPLTTALIATFATTYGFMLPISTSANAIAFGSGAIPLRQMVKAGLLVDVSAVLVLVAGVPTLLRLVGVG